MTRCSLILAALLAGTGAPVLAADKAWSDCEQSEDADRAIAGCTTVLARGTHETTGNRASAFVNRGVSYQSKGELDRAIADYDQAIRQNPALVIAWHDRGDAYVTKGEPDRAIADLTEAIRLSPKFAMSFSARAEAWLAKGDVDRAIADYGQAILFDPSYTAAYTRRGLAYEKNGDVERARADFKQALAVPQKYEKGKWAHDTARERLAALAAPQAAPSGPDAAPPSSVSQALSKPPGTASPGNPAVAERRIALVIGNGTYSSAPRLSNPRNDAQDVAAALKRSGFETIVGLDLDRAGMDDATIRFARAARDADVALFYYSGHALQFAGVNYLMPIDAKLTDEADLRRMTRVDEVVADLQPARSVRILVLDSCRDNPLAEDLKRTIGLTRAASLQRGLARIDAPQGMIVAYATQAGRTAADGTERNSPYTAAFLKHIEARDEIGVIFRRISADVYESTKHAQLPELSLSLIGEFFLRGKVQVMAPPTADPAALAWTAVKDTTSTAVLEDFVRRHGDSIYGTLARVRLEELKKGQTADAPAEKP
ncbi:MAG: caspase family protein [Xanthobacteraceae bacterium]